MKKYYKSKVFLLLVSGMLCVKLGAEPLTENSAQSEALPEFDCLIEPGEVVDVGSPAHGVIEKVFVDRGDFVALGEPLSKLDSSVEQAALELARTRANSTVEIELSRENAEFSKRLHLRNQALFHKSAISSHEMDRLATEQTVAEMYEQEAKNKNKIAQMEYRRALEVVNQKTIFSPLKGVIMEKYKSAGEYVENEPLLRVAQLDPLRIEVIVAADYWGQLAPGQTAQVTPEFHGLGIKEARIERIDPVVDSASGTFRVQLALPNPDHQIAAGLKCQLAFKPRDEQVIPAKYARFSVEKKVIAAKQARSEKLQPLSQLPVLARKGIKAQGEAAQVLAPPAQKVQANKAFLAVKDYAVRSTFLAGQAQVEAFTGRLKTQKISDFYIQNIKGKGYRVSLGLYRNLDNARGRLEKLNTLGFEVELAPRYKKCLSCSAKNLVAAVKTENTQNKAEPAVKGHVPALTIKEARGKVQMPNLAGSEKGRTGQNLPAQLPKNKPGKRAGAEKKQPVAKVDGYYVRSRHLSEQAQVKAFTSRLQSQNIHDFYVIKTKGQAGYRVALGLYRSRKNALNRAGSLQDLGFEVELSPRYRACPACPGKTLVAKAKPELSLKAQVTDETKKKPAMAALSAADTRVQQLVQSKKAQSAADNKSAADNSSKRLSVERLSGDDNDRGMPPAVHDQSAAGTILDYAVYSALLSQKVEVKAFTARLKAENIRDFYVKKVRGAEGFTVALGVYKRLNNALGRVANLKSLGFEVALNPRYKKCTSCRLNDVARSQPATGPVSLAAEKTFGAGYSSTEISAPFESLALMKAAP